MEKLREAVKVLKEDFQAGFIDISQPHDDFTYLKTLLSLAEEVLAGKWIEVERLPERGVE
jgi:hypothetical protein